VRGDVRYDTLQVDKGGVLDGRTAHGDEAEALAADAAVETDVDDVSAPGAPPPTGKLRASRASQAPAPIGAG
jgi:hypothetical protein